MDGKRIVPASVKVEDWTWCDVYTADRATLIKAQLATEAQFPGEAGNGKTMVTFHRGVRVAQGANVSHDEHYIQVARAGKLFKVKLGLSLEQQKQRRKQKEDREQAEARKLAQVMLSPKLYLTLLADQVRRAAVVVGMHSAPEGVEQVGPNPYPYSLQKDTWGTVLAKLDEVVEFIEAASVQTRTDPAVLSAKKDDAFQKFLAAQCLGAE